MKALIVIALLGVVAMMSDVFRYKRILLPLVIAGLVAAFIANFTEYNSNTSYFNNMLLMDNYAVAFTGLLIVISILWVILSPSYFHSQSSKAEHASLILFSLAGGLVMVGYEDLTMLFIGIEILSISMYILASSDKGDIRSNEAGMKYFLMGSFATGFLLFGIALIYGAAGTFNLAGIAEAVHTASSQTHWFIFAGVLLMMVGLLFKVSAVPFHFWAPDVYEGSPTLVTAYMATVVKTAAFAGFYRLFSQCFADISSTWAPVLAVISAVTMLGGNILAVSQKSMKRMLAYSSVAHAGYMLMAIVAMNQVSGGAIFIYAAAYSLASLGGFAVVDAAGKHGNLETTNLKGFGAANRVHAICLAILMLSLAGIPPVAGFFAKYYLFYGSLLAGYTWLVLIAVLSSLIGVYYYFRMIYNCWLPRESGQPVTLDLNHRFLLVTVAFLVLLLGVFPAALGRLF